MLRSILIVALTQGACWSLATDLEEVLARHETSLARLTAIDVEIEDVSLIPEGGVGRKIRLQWSQDSVTVKETTIDPRNAEDSGPKDSGREDSGPREWTRLMVYKGGVKSWVKNQRQLALMKADPRYRSTYVSVCRNTGPPSSPFEFYALREFQPFLGEPASSLAKLVGNSRSSVKISKTSDSLVRLTLRYPGRVEADGKRRYANAPMSIDLDPQHGWMARRISLELENEKQGKTTFVREVQEFAEPAPGVFIPLTMHIDIAGTRRVINLRTLTCNKPIVPDEDLSVHLLEGMLVYEYENVKSSPKYFHMVGANGEYEKTFTNEKEAIAFQYQKILSMIRTLPQTSVWPKVLGGICVVFALGYLIRRMQHIRGVRPWKG